MITEHGQSKGIRYPTRSGGVGMRVQRWARGEVTKRATPPAAEDWGRWVWR